MRKEFRLAAAAASSLLLFTTESWSAGTAKSEAPVAVQWLKNNFCRALSPAGWTVIDQDQRGAIYSVASPDRRMVAGYGIVDISSAQVAGYSGPQYRRPALFAQFLAETAAGEPIAITGSQPLEDMLAIDFKGNTKRGFVIFRAVPLSADPGGYVIAARLAIGTSDADVPVAGAVAASIDCRIAFKAPPEGYEQARDKSSGMGTSEDCKAGDCDDSDMAGTYNVQLGTGYVHSATGTNYIVDLTSDYRATGPDGPGYYRQNGNLLEKLEPGRN